MSCKYCGKPVHITPSAAERSAKYGESPSFYTRRFPNHHACEIAARNAGVSALIKSMRVPVIFQEAEMLRLRQLVARGFGIEAGSRRAADYVNKLTEPELRAML